MSVHKIHLFILQKKITVHTPSRRWGNVVEMITRLSGSPFLRLALADGVGIFAWFRICRFVDVLIIYFAHTSVSCFRVRFLMISLH
jgi:hypothetical protein